MEINECLECANGRFKISKKNGVMVQNVKDATQYNRISSYAKIKTVRVDATTGIESLELEYMRVSTKNIESQWISGENLTGHHSEALVKYGVDINM